METRHPLVMFGVWFDEMVRLDTKGVCLCDVEEDDDRLRMDVQGYGCSLTAHGISRVIQQVIISSVEPWSYLI